MELVDVAGRAGGVAAVGGWARVENAACARRLSAMADVLEARLSADGSAEREQWCLDNWDAVCAEIGAAQNVSLGVASNQLLIAQALRERLARVGEVFATGAVSYRLVAAAVSRTRLITDGDAMAKVDTELAAQIGGWGSLSVAKSEAAIDYWVDRYDPQALRRSESAARDRHVDIVEDSGTGVSGIEGRLFAHDAEALDKRLDAMARAVCKADLRTLDQRRSDALGALAHGADRLSCQCGAEDCEAADRPPSAVVVYVVANEESLSDDSDALMDGQDPPGPSTAELRQMTLAQALAPPSSTGTAVTGPAALMGGALLPAPLLAAKLATTARIERIVHPGEAPPERRYIPSQVLAVFVRCRDMTCRFPGCDEPAHVCDIDHTIAYPVGPTQASNLKCLCRKHHLAKTFGGWRDRQLPNGTVVWTSPEGQTCTTYPGSRILFPSLCKPTAPVARVNVPAAEPSRGLMMPRRKTTRAQDRAKRIEAERRLNDDYVAERNKPPPF
ncbi:MAG: hypothetical protein QOG79_7975 [Mycobacterium sp.]|nr:hypothetical protein [Mycobacterium sp.]